MRISGSQWKALRKAAFPHHGDRAAVLAALDITPARLHQIEADSKPGDKLAQRMIDLYIGRIAKKSKKKVDEEEHS